MFAHKLSNASDIPALTCSSNFQRSRQIDCFACDLAGVAFQRASPKMNFQGVVSWTSLIMHKKDPSIQLKVSTNWIKLDQLARVWWVITAVSVWNTVSTVFASFDDTRFDLTFRSMLRVMDDCRSLSR